MMQAEFDRYAADYAELVSDPLRERFSPGSRFFVERKWLLLERFCTEYDLDLRHSTWIDVGCGKGELLRLGRPRLASVRGCDVSAEMLKDCTDMDVRVQSDPVALPFPDCSADLVTAVCVYHHVSMELRPALTRDVYRVLKPGGIFAIIEHNPLNPITRFIVSRLPVDVDAQLLGSWESRRLTRRAGLKELTTEYFLIFPEGLYHRFSSVEALLRRAPFGGQYAHFAMKR